MYSETVVDLGHTPRMLKIERRGDELMVVMEHCVGEVRSVSFNYRDGKKCYICSVCKTTVFEVDWDDLTISSYFYLSTSIPKVNLESMVKDWIAAWFDISCSDIEVSVEFE